MKDYYKVHCGRLRSNGLRFYTQYDRSDSRELALIVVMVGSIHDPPNRRGLSHLTEHVICAESKAHTAQQVESIMARTLGSESALITTSKTVTTYGPADLLKKSHNRKLFNVFANMIKDPVISKEVCDSEKASINQEHFLMSHDVIGERISELLNEYMFPKYLSARNPIDGRMSEVRCSSIKDIEQHIKRYYIPRNSFVVYLGPNHLKAKEIIKDELGDWSNTSSRRPNFRNRFRVSFHRLKQSKKKTITQSGIHQYHVATGFPTEHYLSNDSEALDILANILSVRMYKKLRIENRSWSKGSYALPVMTERSFLHGLLFFQFATLDKNFMKHSIKTFHKECNYLCENLITRAEAEDWIGYMYDYQFMDYFKKCPSGLADMIIDNVSNGDLSLDKLHNRGDKLLSYLKRGGRSRLREIAQKYFYKKSACIIVKPS